MKRFAVLFLLLGLAACAEQATRSESLIPVEERYVPAEQRRVTGSETDLAGDRESVAPTVIASLMTDANLHARAGRTDKAVASIERALRIEPNNPLLWHRFAGIRLQEKNWDQAIALARKSNALAAAASELVAANWDIIAQAYEGKGNMEKAREARKRQRLSG